LYGWYNYTAVSSILGLPLPGELLWSAFCRLQLRLPYLPISAIAHFGGYPTRQVAKYFPTHLERFADALPHMDKPSAEAILAANTMFPFVAPFLPVHETGRTKMAMLGHRRLRSHQCHVLIGAVANAPLRYCPDCVSSDLERYGQMAWRAMHQLRPLAICPLHHAVLVETPILRRDLGYQPLANFTRETPPVYSRSALQGALARAALDLSTRPPHEVGPSRLRLACLLELERTGRKAFGRKAASELEAELRSVFFADLGDPRCGVVLDGRWVRRLVSGPAPILPLSRYAVLCHVLRISLERLITIAQETSEPEDGPWPCVSTGMRCSGKKTVPSFLSFPGKHRFRCPHCATIYFRKIPLRGRPDGSFEYTLAKGSAINAHAAAFVAAWNDPKETWATLSARFGMDVSTIGYNAARRGLSDMPGLTLTALKRHLRKKVPLAAQIAAKRATVLAFLAKHPQRLGQPLPDWVYRTERWLHAQGDTGVLKPTARKAMRRPGGHRCAQRDTEIAQLISRRAKEISQKLRAPGQPQVKLGTVLRFLAPSMVLGHQNLPRMPKTRAVIANLLETAAEARERRGTQIIATINTQSPLPCWTVACDAFGVYSFPAADRDRIRAAYLVRRDIRRTGRPRCAGAC